jgi:anti-sigma factor RsiW
MTRPEFDDRSLLLHAALDGELDAAGVIEIERLLAADPELAAEYARLKALREAIRAKAQRERAPDSLRLRMMELAETKQAPRREAKTARWRDPPSWKNFAAAMAATVVVTLGLQHLIEAGNAPDAALQAIVSAHMRSQISGQPVDVVSTDRHTVKPWLAGKLPVAADVVDLAEAGFPLAGGRIDIVAGAGVPTLVYRRRDHLISVTELRADKGDDAAIPRHLAVEGYPIVRWSDNERAYVAVSDLSPTELDAFVAAFRQAVAKEGGGGGGGGSGK